MKEESYILLLERAQEELVLRRTEYMALRWELGRITGALGEKLVKVRPSLVDLYSNQIRAVLGQMNKTRGAYIRAIRFTEAVLNKDPRKFGKPRRKRKVVETLPALQVAA